MNEEWLKQNFDYIIERLVNLKKEVLERDKSEEEEEEFIIEVGKSYFTRYGDMVEIIRKLKNEEEFCYLGILINKDGEESENRWSECGTFRGTAGNNLIKECGK